MNLPFWQRTEGVRANNKRAVLVVYSKESPCLLRCTIALPKKSSVEPDAPTTVRKRRCILRDVFCFGRRSEGMQRASGKPPLASLHANFPEGESSLRVWRADYGAGAQVHLTRCCFALAGDPKGCRGRAKSPCLCRRTPASPKGNPRWGFDAPTTARLVGCRPEGGSTFFRSERKYQRKHAARRLQRRPTSLCTATKPCAALGLGYALHGFQPFLALVGLRPPWAVGFGLREPNGWTTRINSGRPIPA